MKQYRITNANPLIIERTSQAQHSTVAYLEERRDLSIGRTNATSKGFDFTGIEAEGQRYTGLVFFDGYRRATYRCAIEIPGGHLSDPDAYHSPWPWSEVKVFDGPIEDGPARRRKKRKPEPDATGEH